MSFSPKEILNFVQENDVKFIRLTFCDMHGNLKNIAVMPGELERAFSHGILLDAASFSECYHDLLLQPDISTLSVLPWRPKSGRVVRFFCNIMNPDGTPYQGDLRHAIQSYTQELYTKGYACEVGTRCEFYLFDLGADGEPTKQPHDHAGYLDVAPLDKCENTRREICLSLEEMGLNPKSSCHKHGPGQNEIDFKSSEPGTAADNMVHYKNVVKTIAAQNGLYASFMPKPLGGMHGSALAMSLSVKYQGEHIFRMQRDELSTKGQAFVAGILRHMREMTLFLNPTTNSYTRLRHSGAPNHINWSQENRNPLLRIPHTMGEAPRIEVRSADGCCNPYISLRLLLGAGMEGIEEGLTLSEQFRICDGKDEQDFATLPSSLREAYTLAKDSAFIARSLPQEIRDTVYKNIETQLALHHAAEDKTQFEDSYYFLSV